ncbi:MAG: alpha/beta hydrolase, partial [Pseudomonadota bacterium]
MNGHDAADLARLALDAGIASRQVQTATGLDMHVLEAGASTNPLLMLLHGFQELALSWRRIMR